MATRFYLSSTDTSALTPGYAAWSRTTEGDRYEMLTTKDASALGAKTCWGGASSSAGQFALARQYISLPLSAGIAFATSDTVSLTAAVLESAANDNIDRLYSVVKVVSQDGNTLRATLLALGAGPYVTELGTSQANRAFRSAAALTSAYTTVAGDRLVIELGLGTSTAGTSVTGTIRFGCSSATDFAVGDGSATDNNPWFEISRTLTFLRTDAFTGSGGAQLDGTADFHKDLVGSPSGGLLAGGAADWSDYHVPAVRNDSFTGSGGLLAGGVAPFSMALTAVGSGGLQGGGAADFHKDLTATGAGGLLAGGTAAANIALTATGSGGLLAGGAALISDIITRHDAFVGSGGLTAGGTADATKALTATGSGGLQAGGSAPSIKDLLAQVSGGLLAAGFALVSMSITATGSGGGTLGGSATWSDSIAGNHRTDTFTGSGGLVAGGSADATKALVATGAGGLQASGAADFHLDLVAVGSGGAQGGGSAVWSDHFESIGIPRVLILSGRMFCAELPARASRIQMPTRRVRLTLHPRTLCLVLPPIPQEVT